VDEKVDEIYLVIGPPPHERCRFDSEEAALGCHNLWVKEYLAQGWEILDTNFRAGDVTTSLYHHGTGSALYILVRCWEEV